MFLVSPYGAIDLRSDDGQEVKGNAPSITLERDQFLKKAPN